MQTANELGNGLWSTTLNFRIETSSGILQFSADNYTVNEGEATATITVTRTGGTAGTVSVDYASTDDSAIAGSDYTAVLDTLNWADGEATAKTFTVNIIDDSTVEDQERLYLSLGNVTGGAAIGNPNTAALTITDNDSLDDPSVSNVQVNPTSVQAGDTQTVSWQSNNQAWYFFYLYDLNDQPVNTNAFLSADCQAGGSDGSDGCLGQENPSTNTSDSWIIPMQLAAGSYKIKVAVWNSSSQSAGALSEAFTLSGGTLDTLLIDFGTQYGIWLRVNNSTWVQLHTLSPESMVTGDIDVNGQDEVIIDFGETYGIWLRMNNSTWVQLHTLSPESMVTGDIDGGGQDDVIIDFGEPYGIWVLMNNSSWIQLHTLSPESLVTGDIDGGGQDEVIIDFGETYGIWVRMNNSSWVQLHTLSPESMVTGDIDNSGQDEVIIDFGSLYGIWLMMNNSNWVQLHTLSPESMVTGDIDGGGQDDVIIDFGSPYGIWSRMNNSSWVQLHNISPESLVTGDIDGSGQDEVIIDFGASYGIWQWMNNSNWVQLHSLSPEFMVTGNLDGLESDTAISHQAPEDNTMLLPEPIAVPLPKAVTPSGQ
ncbi:Na-Ca exchanger/integrin-beta4 domain protein [Candidatus Thiomargarita nelsonii]|uniref:Na-Ca exchanger/integrin-beta4 domain protein n=1 Tax=Candidatus Thiomargarita nelsonii TaxID=1003181 RepID=A0A176RTP8_9GAMM|nr:Na-Ca exchanger/integrin-beta4 domain protein [Candidatus Thiomargarita nelsonii]